MIPVITYGSQRSYPPDGVTSATDRRDPSLFSTITTSMVIPPLPIVTLIEGMPAASGLDFGRGSGNFQPKPSSCRTIDRRDHDASKKNGVCGPWLIALLVMITPGAPSSARAAA